MPATYIFFLREERPDRRGQCPVILKITHNRKRKYVSTGIRIDPKHWNADRQEVRRGNSTHNKLNHELERIREDAMAAYRELNRNRQASADAIKKRIEYSSKDNFFTLAKEYLDALKPESFYSWKQAKVAVEKVKQFHGSDQLPVNLIDPDFMTRLQAHLKKGRKNSTVLKNLAAIKNILNLAVQRHLLPMNPMNSENFRMVKNEQHGSKTKLSLEEMHTIEKLDLPEGSNIWHSRNAFILSFYFCGMRFGDVAQLRWSNIKNGRLSYDMAKTGNHISIPIKDGARAILDRYQQADNNGYVFPFLASIPEDEQGNHQRVREGIGSWNALVNGQLKDIARAAGIDEEISMHVARHSFAQYGVNDRNIPPYKMMMLLGHKSIKTTMQYLKSLDLKTVDSVMDEIF